MKALVWNAMGLAMMTLVGLIATGSAALGGMVALVNTAIGLTMYVIYERIWAGISWGRNG
ncbi:Predicted membrane protein [Ruegeria halocynthiae]|uniref:Predicted membrane protein n=1 Tax=Ruegeria halocynthiae TaxID=985054 RepID=A0A1H2SQE2_9RHOB|nr:Predicted membrane protein [Ruegeria halocynthiae]